MIDIQLLMWRVADALQFYADPRNYEGPKSRITTDNGHQARVALQLLKGEDVG